MTFRKFFNKLSFRRCEMTKSLEVDVQNYRWIFNFVLVKKVEGCGTFQGSARSWLIILSINEVYYSSFWKRVKPSFSNRVEETHSAKYYYLLHEFKNIIARGKNTPLVKPICIPILRYTDHMEMRQLSLG